MKNEIEIIGENQELQITKKETRIAVKTKCNNGVEEITQTVKRENVSDLDKTFWDSYKIDEFKIAVTLDNKSDVDHLIDFLKIHKICLSK